MLFIISYHNGRLCNAAWSYYYWTVHRQLIIIPLNSLMPRQNGCHFPDGIFKCIFLNENVWISLKMFILDVRTYNILALVQIMACRRPGDKPFSKPMMVNLQRQMCVARPQWVKRVIRQDSSLHQWFSGMYGFFMRNIKGLMWNILFSAKRRHENDTVIAILWLT